MVEHVVHLEITETYSRLKALLLENGCKIIGEGPPTAVSVQHGSLWGVSPETAKKIMHYYLSPFNSGTRISCSSALASDWKNLTLIGSVFAVILSAFCWWISVDLDAFLASHGHSYWSWIASANGFVDYQALRVFRDLACMLAVFLMVVMAVEAGIVVYVSSRLEAVAEEKLRVL